MKKPITFIALFLVGAIVMFAFDSTITLFVGMFLQLGSIGVGVFAIATPEFLESDESAAAPKVAAEKD